MRAPLVVLGDALLDREIDGRAERLCPEQPVPVLDASTSRSAPGGAALAAALLARDGRDVALVTALGRDDAGAELRDLLFEERVTVVDIGLDGATPEKTRIRSGPSLLCRVDRGTGRPRASIGQSARRLLEQAQAVLVSDYGGGMTSIPAARDALAAARCVVWDPHPRGASPAPLAALVTPNEREARLAALDLGLVSDADREWRALELRGESRHGDDRRCETHGVAPRGVGLGSNRRRPCKEQQCGEPSHGGRMYCNCGQMLNGGW